MKKFTTLSKVAATAIVGSVLFVGCGSDSLSSLGSSLSGKNLSDYLVSGRTFIDCKDTGVVGQLDANEVYVDYSDAKGKYSLSSNSSFCGGGDYSIITINGKKTDGTDVPMLKAPKGVTTVSPLSTIIADMNSTERSDFLTSMGFDEADLAIDYNVQQDDNATQAKAAKFGALKTLIETVLASATATDNNTIKNLGALISSTVKDLNLSGNDLNVTAFNSALKAKITGSEFSYVANTIEANINSVQSAVEAIAAAKSVDSNISAAIAAAETATKTIVDKAAAAASSYVTVVNNTITVAGIDAVVANGNFGTVTKKPAEIDLDANTSLFDVSFSIDTTNFESNVTKLSSVAVSIDEQSPESSRYLNAYIDRVLFTKDANDVSSVTVPAGAVLKAEAMKATGQKVSVSITNTSENVFTATSDTVNINLKDIFDRLNGQISSDLATLAQNEATYNVKAVITGLDINETVSGQITVGDEVISGKSISGVVAVTNNEAPVITLDPTSSTITVTRGETSTVNVSVSDDANETITPVVSSSNTDVATVSLSGSTATVTAVAKGTATITVTATDSADLAQTKTFTVEVPNTAPTVTSISTQSATQNTAITNIQVNASDVDGDTLTYYAMHLPTGVDIDSATGVISGTPTVSGDFSVYVEVSDGTDMGTTSFDMNVSVDSSAPTWNEIVNEHDLSADYNDKKVTAALNGTLSASTITIDTTATIPTGIIQDTTNLQTIYIVETAGDTTNFIEFKYKTDSYSAGDKFNITVGTKECEIVVGQSYTDDEIVLN